jgi:hypothetical protein
MNYRLLILIEVVEFLERLPSKTWKSLRNAIAAIGGDFALTYWIDDADHHVKILDLHAADR